MCVALTGSGVIEAGSLTRRRSGSSSDDRALIETSSTDQWPRSPLVDCTSDIQLIPVEPEACAGLGDKDRGSRRGVFESRAAARRPRTGGIDILLRERLSLPAREEGK